MLLPLLTASAMERYASSSTVSLLLRRVTSDRRSSGLSVTTCDWARLAACSSSLVMLNSSSRMSAEVSQGDKGCSRPRMRRKTDFKADTLQGARFRERVALHESTGAADCGRFTDRRA